MSKKTPPADASLEVILRRWPHLPEHVRKTLVELVGHYGPQAETERFPTPIGAKWEDVEIVLLDDANVRMTGDRNKRAVEKPDPQ